MALLGALILALQVPIVGIYGLVGEREGNRLAAIAEVRESWGGSQLPQGPVLVVPYRSAETPWIDPYERSMGVAYAYLRPHELRIRATMSPIVRTRGIFDVLLYRAAFHFEATFARPDPEELGVEEASILWDAIRVALPSRPSVPDSVAIQDVNVLPARSHLERYVEAPLPHGADGADGRGGRDDRVLAACSGLRLPVGQDVRADGFTSRWEVTEPVGPSLESWPPERDPEAPTFGVELIQPVDAYRMTRRSIKYEFLFTALTLGVFFLIEVFGQYRVHPIQYLMVGSALVDLDIDGSASFSFEATAGTTHVELDSTWPHPKFVGKRLPVGQDVRADGFTSRWEVTEPVGPSLESWPPERDPEAPTFGVELIQPVDAYRMTRRSIKYEFLFTALTLGVFFLIEVFGQYRVHPIQYLMVGSALVLFYLLVLSLSEHITFTAAYALAATGVVLLVSFYARAMFAEGVHVATVTATLSLIYGFLFVLLALQDYSLVMGSLGLFVVLASVMFLTRKIDWYAWSAKLSA